MILPYRTRRALRNIGVIVLVVALAAALILACWFMWLDRFVVYTRENGAVVDFSQNPQLSAGVEALPTQPRETVPLYYNEGSDKEEISTELAQMAGYYIEPEDLQDMDNLRQQLRALEEGTAVMVDVKTMKGDFYYNSAISTRRSSQVDAQEMDELISYLNKSGLYTIARLPALRDYYYGLNHVPNGLFHSSRQYLWMDDDGCYWLNPASDGTFSYLVQIVSELKALGFDEVVFSDFRFPDTDAVYFEGDKNTALVQTAEKLVNACSSDTFAVSFLTSPGRLPLIPGRSRLYVSGISAANLAEAVELTGVENPAVNLVFLTEVHDTRFDVYSVLRPLSTAH